MRIRLDHSCNICERQDYASNEKLSSDLKCKMISIYIFHLRNKRKHKDLNRKERSENTALSLFRPMFKQKHSE